MTTIGVCGFGRCGSTMAMAMLDAGGVPPVPGSQPGSYELPGLGPDFPAHDGHAVKLLDWVLRGPLPEADWRFVWVDRGRREQARSTVKFVSAIVGEELADDAEDRLVASYVADRPRALATLRKAGPVVILRYETVLADPQRAAERIARFAGPGFDVAAATAVVHDRDGRCLPGLEFELSTLGMR